MPTLFVGMAPRNRNKVGQIFNLSKRAHNPRSHVSAWEQVKQKMTG
jgi:hypothetical protein